MSHLTKWTKQSDMDKQFYEKLGMKPKAEEAKAIIEDWL